MDLEKIAGRIRGEFREMPGLHLTPAQAMRLWGLERDMCHAIIERLVASAFLRWTRGGTIALVDSRACHSSQHARALNGGRAAPAIER